MKRAGLLAITALILAACGKETKEYDATGTFEATETTIYAEQSGRLLRFDVEEGCTLEKEQEVGLIDTLQTFLKIRQLQASQKVYASQRPDVEKQVAALRQQLAKAQMEERRFSELVKDGAAPRKTLDDAVSQVEVLKKQLEAQQSALNTNTEALNQQMATADAQMNQLGNLLKKCRIASPIAGTVLEKYVENGEFVNMGKPLFKMADTENMFIRAYVTTAQLQNIKPGQRVKVMSDYGKGNKKTYNGRVAWISNRSEFTPKTILTDDERADLVYAVKIAVKNDGYIKIGMYGEVKF
ncbi:MAG: HlyD family efflux transporter periplasmic adaptor subunit [Prevotellaceae bacterium]|nr:HlyD family efflux transporter periplasmic adaptor subunit [Prevotella sp.]MDD7258212.1 HlyD family efflux transporter periplasmic adaptor subunit [Prevotellaceae bacterium]MDY6130605.1 HlyD family efflux transporter periplasmic adaptor subunit [Prevotella sp.]